jgi:hypothetical protein
MFLLLQNADIKNRILSIENRNNVLVTTHIQLTTTISHKGNTTATRLVGDVSIQEIK